MYRIYYINESFWFWMHNEWKPLEDVIADKFTDDIVELCTRIRNEGEYIINIIDNKPCIEMR